MGNSNRRPSVPEPGGTAPPPGPAPAPGLMAQVSQGYNELVKAIIRPPRSRYTLDDLGGSSLFYRGRPFVRTDLELRNARGMRICCSHWEPAPAARPAKELPCVVYLHGNSSSRVGCLENLGVVLAEGATMFAFDFTGSGLSAGEWVTLGFYEKDDLAAVVDYLRSTGTVSTIALWGRSMGAATALLHTHRDPSIAAMVLDSPFADLRQLAGELVELGKARSGYKIPGFVVSAAISLIRSSVLKKTGMDILALRPIADVGRSFVPVLFCAGAEDEFVKPHHSEQICAAYMGDKSIRIVPGDHNSVRPRSFQDMAGIFLRTRMGIPDALTLDAPLARLGGDGGGGARSPYPRGATRDAGYDDDEDDPEVVMALEASRLEAAARMSGLIAEAVGGSADSGLVPPPRISRPPMPRIGPLASGSGAAAAALTAASSRTSDSVERDSSVFARGLTPGSIAWGGDWGPATAAAAAHTQAALIAASPARPLGTAAASRGDDEDEEAMLQRAIAASLAPMAPAIPVPVAAVAAPQQQPPPAPPGRSTQAAELESVLA